MKKTLLVVGCGFPQLGLLRAARALDLNVVGLDQNPRAVGVPLLDRFVAESTADTSAIVRVAREINASAITTTGSELALTTTSSAAFQLELPFYTDLATIHRCQAKDAMRSAYASAGLPVPAFAFARSFDEAKSHASTLVFPLVVKPARGWGQRGVSRIDDFATLEHAFHEASRVSHGDAGVVIEEFIEGRELSVNGWVEDGALVSYAVTDREVFPGSAPLGVMRSEIVPSTASAIQVDSAILAATRAARALGLDRGPCYTQVSVGPRGTYVFETAARCGGGFDADVTRLISGVDLYRRLLGVALGEPDLEREGARTARHPAALVRFLAAPSGIVNEVSGLEAARMLDGVIDADVYVREGDRSEGLLNAASRAGHILAVGTTRSEAVSRADLAEKTITIEAK